MLISKLKPLLAAFGDLIILYGALILTLMVRYGLTSYGDSFIVHLKPFSIIFIIWFLIFYLSDLYSNKFFKLNLAATRVFIIAIVINLFLSVVAFYAFESFFQLTPKTNLLIFGVIFGILDYLWRLFLRYSATAAMLGELPIIKICLRHPLEMKSLAKNNRQR